MTTLTFKVNADEARRIRAAARRSKLSLSEYLRRQVHANAAEPKPVDRVKCRYTGATIFAASPQYGPLNAGTVKEILADFP